MTNAARVAAAVALAVVAWVAPRGPGAGLGARVAHAAEATDAWRKEFDDICGKTQDAMALSTEELKSLVTRCDALKPAIEALDASTRKVYSRRLKACRDLFQYVVEYREQPQG